MTFIDLIGVWLIAALVSAALVGALGWRYPAREEGLTAVLFVFSLVSLILWAARLSVVPTVVPAGFWISGWLWLVIIGVLLALEIGAVAPLPRRRLRAHGATEPGIAPLAFGIFFWRPMVALPVLIVAGYAYL